MTEPESGQEEGARLAERLDAADPFWPAQLAVLAAIVLYVALPSKLTAGPGWLLPSVEGVLFIGLVVLSPRPRVQFSTMRRRLALALIGLVSLVNLVSLGLLVHYLLRGGKAGGHPLILGGINLWITNVLVFAVWYWELDRGGPLSRKLGPEELPDFLFPQMDKPEFARPGWKPNFVDYLYVSLTNATAFSPTDTMPLSQLAKVLMGTQGVASLLIIGLVVARAVNILA